MAMCEAGKEIPGQDLTPEKLLVEDSWGELWRAEHRSFGVVLFAAYSTSEGMKLFKQALPALKRLHEGGGVSTDILLRIKMVSEDSAIPYTLIEDPGGKSYYDFTNDETKIIDYEKIVDWGIQLFDGLVLAGNMGISPIGITPKTLLFDVVKKDTNPWRIVPILPTVKEQAVVMENGRYCPQELLTSSHPGMLNADVYAVTWLMVNAIARNYEMRHDPDELGQVVEAQKLLMALMVGTQAAQGALPEPAAMGSQLKRWRRAEAEADLKVVRKKQTKEKKAIEKAKKKGVSYSKDSKKKKGDKPGTSAKHAGVITGVEQKGPGLAGAALTLLKIVAFLGTAYGAYLLVIWLLVSEATNQTAGGTAELFIGGLIQRDKEVYTQYTNSITSGQAQSIAASFDAIDRNPAMVPVSYAGAPLIDRVSTGFMCQVTIYDENDSNVMVLMLQIEPRTDPPGTFHITGMDTQGLTPAAMGMGL